MNELISISSSTIDGQSVNTVNARDLHAFLESKQDFSSWVKVQIERARLVENRDYLVFTKKGENPNGGRPSLDYYLTLDAAKHVAMMSGTDKGFEVRDYFIECERRAQSISQPFKLPSTFAEALRALADESEKTAALQKQIELDRPKTIFADAVTVSHTTILVGELAKLLKQNGFEIGQNRLFERLRKDGWLIKRHGSDWNMPTQKGMELGLFEIKERTVNDANGAVRITKTVKVTGRGQVFFINLFIKERDGAAVPVQADEQEVVGSPADIAPVN
jgi:anti-repressor protein